MAKAKRLVLKKMPKKPKASASIKVKENYLKKRTEIEKENTKRKSDFNKEKKKVESLNKKIAGLK